MPTVAPLDLDGYCVAVAFIRDIPLFAMADGSIHRLDNGHKHEQVHDGLLCAVKMPDGKVLLSGGEDGKATISGADGTSKALLDLNGKWITAVAGGPSGAVAAAAGRSVHFVDGLGSTRTFEHPRSAEGVAFAPKGMRLAVARYNGATLHWPATDAAPQELEWKGAHTGATFSPDGAYLVTTMQENALHGWRLSDQRHMRMTGYPAKVKGMSWSVKGRWLATTGAPAAIVWPFQGKDGPMGKAPLELGTRGDQLVTAVACHPAEDIVAIGYGDGMVLAARMGDGNEALLRRPGKGAVTSMDWDSEGIRLAFGTEAGDCGVVDIRG